MIQVGVEQLLKVLIEGNDLNYITEKFEKEVKMMEKKEEQSDKNKIRRSNFVKHYKNCKTEIGMEKYWEKKNYSMEIKEPWARIRCGSVGRGKEKRFRDDKSGIAKSKKKV